MAKVSSIATSIIRDRYFQINSNLKLMDRIKNGCQSLPGSQEVAIDEQMILFPRIGHMKPFVRGKPNRERCVILDFDIYQDKHTFLENEDTHFGVPVCCC